MRGLSIWPVGMAGVDGKTVSVGDMARVCFSHAARTPQSPRTRGLVDCWSYSGRQRPERNL